MAVLDAWGGTFRCLFNQECALKPAHQGATGRLSTVQKCIIFCLLLHPFFVFSISLFAYWEGDGKYAVYDLPINLTSNVGWITSLQDVFMCSNVWKCYSKKKRLLWKEGSRLWSTASEPMEHNTLLAMTPPVRRREVKGSMAMPDPLHSRQTSLVVLIAGIFKTKWRDDMVCESALYFCCYRIMLIIRFTPLLCVFTRNYLHALMFNKHRIFLKMYIAAAPLFILCLNASFVMCLCENPYWWSPICWDWSPLTGLSRYCPPCFHISSVMLVTTVILGVLTIKMRPAS